MHISVFFKRVRASVYQSPSVRQGGSLIETASLCCSCAVHLSSWLGPMHCSIFPIGSKVIFVLCLFVRFQPLFIIYMVLCIVFVTYFAAVR